MTMKELSGGHSYLPGTSDTSKDLSEDASPPGALPLQSNEGSARSSESRSSEHETLSFSENDTRYSVTYCHPETFGSTILDDESVIELSREDAIIEEREIEGLDDLEILRTPDLARTANIDFRYSQLEDHSMSSPESSDFLQLGEVAHYKADQSEETAYFVISNTFSENGMQISNLFNLYSRNAFFRGVVMANHGEIPNMSGTQSMFTPKYSEEVLRPAMSPGSQKSWELGFKASVFQSTERDVAKNPSMARYKIFGDQSLFDRFQTPEHLDATNLAAWIAISGRINPKLQNQATSPKFAKLATDFFGGKEVREDYSLVPEINESRERVKNHSIVYRNSNTAAVAVWEEIHHNAAFARFIIDITLCNDMEKHRSLNSRWFGAKIIWFGIDGNSAPAEIIALLEATKGDSTKTTLPSSSADQITSDFPEIPDSNINATGIQDNKTQASTISQPTTKSEEERNEPSNLENGDEWMFTCRGYEVEKISKKSLNKGHKGRSKRAKRKQVRLAPELDVEANDGASIQERQDISNDTCALGPRADEEESREWILVPKKTTARLGRPSDDYFSTPSTAVMRGPVDNQFRQSHPLLHQNPSRQVPSNKASAQIPRLHISDTVKPYGTARQISPVLSKVDSVQSRKTAATPLSQSSRPVLDPTFTYPAAYRAFVAEEYPALTTNVPSPASLSFIKPNTKTGKVLTPIKNSSVSKAGPEFRAALDESCHTPKESTSTPAKPEATNSNTTRGSLTVGTSAYLETAFVVPAMPNMAGSASPRTLDDQSGNYSTTGNPDKFILSSGEREAFACDDLLTPLHLPYRNEPSEDGRSSEKSSTDFQTEDALIRAEFLSSIDQNEDRTALITMSPAEEQLLREAMYLERVPPTPLPAAKDQLLLDAIICEQIAPNAKVVAEGHSLYASNKVDDGDKRGKFIADFEDSDNESSSIEIFASSSPLKNRSMCRPKRAIGQQYFDTTTSEDSPSTLKAQSQSVCFTRDEASLSDLDAGGGEQSGLSTASYQSSRQIPTENTSTINIKNHVYGTGPFIQVSELAIHNDPFLLFSEAEVSRVVASKEIESHSTTHASNGVKVPKLFADFLDTRDSVSEIATLKTESAKITLTKTPEASVAPHSAKPEAAIPSFLYDSSDDEDSDLMTLALQPEEQVNARSTTVSETAAKGLSLGGNHSEDRAIAEASESPHLIMDESVSELEPYLYTPRCQLAHADRIELVASSLSDFAANLPSFGKSHGQEVDDSASVFNEATSDSQMSVPTSICNLIVEPGGSIDIEQETYAIDATVSGSLPGLPRSISNQTLALISDTNPVRGSISYELHVRHSDNGFMRRHSSASHHGFGSPSQPMNQSSLLHGRRILFHSRNARLSPALSIGSSELISHRQPSLDQSEGYYAGDMALNSQILDHAGVLSTTSSDTVFTQSPTATSQFATNCTYCGETNTPNIQSPQVLCSGCGPSSNIRYCSIACLLVDSLAHAGHCRNYVAIDRATLYELPSMFVYIQNPIMSEPGYFESPERYRQRTFSMHCSSGLFPKLLKSWMKKYELIHSDSNTNEPMKRTGDYVVFRSNFLPNLPRSNPDADVIYTIKFHRDDIKKQVLRRTLNACFAAWNPLIVEFLYRLLRHYILDPEYFSMFKYTEPLEVVWPEFEHQFSKEFGFDASMQRGAEQLFDSATEWEWISNLITQLESQHPVLTQWLNH